MAGTFAEPPEPPPEPPPEEPQADRARPVTSAIDAATLFLVTRLKINHLICSITALAAYKHRDTRADTTPATGLSTP
jgi:hypothetical protein